MIIVGYDGIFNGQILVGGEINRKRDDNRKKVGEGRGIFKIEGVEEVSGEKIRIECK